MKNPFEHIYLLHFFFRRYRVLLIIGGGALILSVIFSGRAFIKPRYKSFAVIYPVNIIPYGEESATEQVLQLLESDFIKNNMIEKFNLYKHYKIDSTKASHYYYISSKYDERINIRKTEYESVKIEVTDENPERASDMVVSVIDFMNLKARELQREKTREIYILIRNQMNEKEAEMDSLALQVQGMRSKYELIDIDAQSREVVRGYLGTIEGSSPAKLNIEGIERYKKHIESYGVEYNKVSQYLSTARQEYLSLKNQFENAKKEIEKELTYANFVIKPFPADKKSYPVRWLIVVASVIGSVLLGALLLMIRENWQSILPEKTGKAVDD